MNIVYVLTIGPNGLASAHMNLVSAWSIRYSNPSFKITVVCDNKSYCCLNEHKHKLLDNIDHIINVEKIDGDNNYVNRFIKTSLIQLVYNDFLYLDADTFVKGSLGDLSGVSEDIAGVANHNNIDSSKIVIDELNKIKYLNWNIPKSYINGGFLHIKNNDNSKKFFEIYHNKWKESCKKLNDHRDQHCLSSAIEDSGVSLKVLPKKYNAQGYCGPTNTIKPEHDLDAIVYHTYGYDWKNSIFSNINSFEDIEQINIGKNIWK